MSICVVFCVFAASEVEAVLCDEQIFLSSCDKDTGVSVRLDHEFGPALCSQTTACSTATRKGC